MIQAVNCTALSVALEKLREIVAENNEKGLKTVIFCEDRLSLAAERTVCSAVGGTFNVSVYTFARFLSSRGDRSAKVLSSQGSAMAVRRIIEENRSSLTLFKKLSATGAAQAVYDTIALLYSSRVSAEDTKSAAACGGVLSEKLHDIALIYEKYSEYLETNGFEDRNNYLRKLAPLVETDPLIKGGATVFLGFQTLTCASVECVRAAFSSARDVYGLFIGGAEDIYVNEATAAFIAAAEEFGGAKLAVGRGNGNPSAEALRTSLFDPESYFRPPVKAENVYIYEATDSVDELNFIAAIIKKHVAEGVRYGKISVMLPDLANCEREISRVFSQYRIPFYADRQHDLSEHSLCSFVTGFLTCLITGCRPEDVDVIVASPYFPATDKQRDIFRNYALRLANYRGGVRREPDRLICENCGFDYDAVISVRSTFLRGLKALSDNVDSSISAGVSLLFDMYGVKDKTEELSKKFGGDHPARAAFGKRAYEGIFTVLSEAESLSEGLPLKEFLKILKSGFAAMKISLIPPKADAVFVGDIAATANTGSDVVIAARLTGDVPATSTDAALLTDREISVLEGADINISPKIRQVNARRRETVALNVCAFRKFLYLTYPVSLNGEESGVSEIVKYASAAFTTAKGERLSPMTARKLERSGRATAFYCSEKIPAIKRMADRSTPPEVASALYAVLEENGFKAEADAALKKSVHADISCGKDLYLNYNSLSPTALESYFLCPYLSFVRQGLKVSEREEGAVRAVDTGNFIHSVLQDVAKELNGIKNERELSSRAHEIASEKLSKAPYSALYDSGCGRYTADRLVDEAVKVSLGMYEQIENSAFTVSRAEIDCEVRLDGGIKVFGRVDRVDTSGDMVRVIDYKTGKTDPKPTPYYMGEKLQLPLYLLSVSEGKRAVGAYYFPASVRYRDEENGAFRLQGFMDGSEEVITASDVTVQRGKKSNYIEASLGANKSESVMPCADFVDFLQYSRLVARQGAEEMLSGNITPSPAKGVCDWCKAGGSCGFAAGKDGGIRTAEQTVKCSDIANIARREGDK